MARVLVACEESQEVCKAFRALGHEAYSCDLLPCSGGHPEWHHTGDAVEFMKGWPFGYWDLVIAHPPCTRLTNSGVRWLHERQMWRELLEAINFFNSFKVGTKYCIENPIPHKYAVEGFHSGHWQTPGIGKYDQLIQPWQFGHGETKATCLWLNGLPLLKPTNIVEGREQRIWKMAPGPDRAKQRSKTFPGIAKAMAEQWGPLLTK